MKVYSENKYLFNYMDMTTKTLTLAQFQFRVIKCPYFVLKNTMIWKEKFYISHFLQNTP